MSEFQLYFVTGFEHISDLSAYDHILFVTALCAIYPLAEWRKLIILITAFTLGHSATLALATLKIISFDTDLIEFLIPVTILITAANNYVLLDRKNKRMWFRYTMAAFFGLIHGMGFSNYLSSLLGKEQSLIMPLFAFNLGLEVGQLLIVAVVMVLAWLWNLSRLPQRDWRLLVTGAVASISITLIADTWIF